MFSLPNHLCCKPNRLILSKVLLACLMHNNRKRQSAAAAALAKSVNFKNASTAENGGVMHSSPGSTGKVRSNTFPIVFTVHGKYRGCDFFKKRSVCRCIIRQGNASQLVPTVQMSWSPLIPRKRELLLQMTVYAVWKVHSLGLTRKHTTQVKAGWLLSLLKKKRKKKKKKKKKKSYIPVIWLLHCFWNSIWFVITLWQFSRVRHSHHAHFLSHLSRNVSLYIVNIQYSQGPSSVRCRRTFSTLSKWNISKTSFGQNV